MKKQWYTSSTLYSAFTNIYTQMSGYTHMQDTFHLNVDSPKHKYILLLHLNFKTSGQDKTIHFEQN